VEKSGASSALAVTVSFEELSTPIVGVVRAPDETTRPFTGWMGLFSVLQSTVEELAEQKNKGVET